MIEIRRRRGRRLLAILTVLAALGTIAYVSVEKVADKNALFTLLPVSGVLGATLVLPWLSRASSGAREAALAYIGGPCGFVFALPFGVLPAKVVPYAGSGFALVGAALVFAYEMRAKAISIEKRWLEVGERRITFDEVIGVAWDALEIHVGGVVTKIESVARLLVSTREGRRITFDSFNDAVAPPTLAHLRDALHESLGERISDALERGEAFATPNITFAPDHIELRRPRWWSLQELLTVLAVFGAIPMLPGVAMWFEDREPGGFLSLIPLGAILLVLGIDALLRRRPVVLDAQMTATLDQGRLVWIRGKRKRSVALRFLPNGMLVPPVLGGIRRRPVEKP